MYVHVILYIYICIPCMFDVGLVKPVEYCRRERLKPLCFSSMDSMRVYPAAMCTIPPCQLGSWKFMKYVIRCHDPDFIIFHRPLIEFGGFRLFHAFSRVLFSILYRISTIKIRMVSWFSQSDLAVNPGLSHATELLREAHASGAGRNPLALKPWGRCFVNGSMLISLLRKFEFCVSWMVSWCFMHAVLLIFFRWHLMVVWILLHTSRGSRANSDWWFQTCLDNDPHWLSHFVGSTTSPLHPSQTIPTRNHRRDPDLERAVPVTPSILLPKRVNSGGPRLTNRIG